MDNITTVALREQRISPKKARLVLNSVRGALALDAMVSLGLQDKKGSVLVKQLLKNAIDAAQAKDFKAEELYVSEAVCQEGRKLKRNQVKARGRSTAFQKRMSHLKISLAKNVDNPDGKRKIKASNREKEKVIIKNAKG